MTESTNDQSPAMIIPPFNARRLLWRLRAETAARWGAVLAMLVLVSYIAVAGPGGGLISGLTLLIVAGGWIGMGIPSARTMRDLPMLTNLILTDPQVGESHLAECLRRGPLTRWAAVMLYHRLAMLRHRQQRFAEAAAICHALLDQPAYTTRNIRSSLLLMLTESSLEIQQPHLAYHALQELYHSRLSLMEAIQRMALQTRYELSIGRHDAALHAAKNKISLAELMPAPQCGAVHAMLATAAEQCQQDPYARWLWSRVDLLCTPEQATRLRQQDFGVSPQITDPSPTT